MAQRFPDLSNQQHQANDDRTRQAVRQENDRRRGRSR
jgi:hypothetical protein